MSAELKLMTTAPPANDPSEKSMTSEPLPPTMVSPPVTVPAPPIEPVFSPANSRSDPGPATRLTLPCDAEDRIVGWGTAGVERFAAHARTVGEQDPARRTVHGAADKIRIGAIGAKQRNRARAPRIVVALAPPMKFTCSALALPLIRLLPPMVPVPI